MSLISDTPDIKQGRENRSGSNRELQHLNLLSKKIILGYTKAIVPFNPLFSSYDPPTGFKPLILKELSIHPLTSWPSYNLYTHLEGILVLHNYIIYPCLI